MNTAVTNIVEFPGHDVSTAIARTATEIASKFFDDNASERAPYKMRAIAYGAASTLSDGAFRLLAIRLIYADNDGTNSHPTQEVLAELMRRDPRSISSLDKELRDAGFMTLNRRANNRSRDLSLRSTSYNLLTHTQMDRIVNEIVFDRKRTSGGKLKYDQKQASTGNIDRKQDSGGNDFDRKSIAVSTGSRLPPTLLNYPTVDIKKREREEDVSFSQGKLKVAAGVIAAALAGSPMPTPADAHPVQPTVIVQTSQSELTYDQLMDKLMDAGGRAMANSAASPGLIGLAAVHAWLEQGCDLEKDVIPAIKAAVAKRPPASIRSWSYFTTAVVNARATRTSPLPNGQAQAKPAERKPVTSSLNGFVTPEWEKDYKW
jgi:hypothetical protein